MGNAGNITAYWMGFKEYSKMKKNLKLPIMMGFQSEGSAPLVKNIVVKDPETGLDTITKQGATLYHMGRTPQQVKSYINKLIEIFEFAKKHNAVVTWA